MRSASGFHHVGDVVPDLAPITFYRTLSTCLCRASSFWIVRASVMPAIGASSSTFALMRRSVSRADAAFCNLNQVLQRRIGHLLTRPVGRPPKKPVVTFTSFRYQAKGWTRARRVVAKVEWHQGELYPRVGLIMTNLSRPSRRVVKFYNGRGTAEQWIKEGKNALR
jgi:Transposase DDE domain group 1